MPDAKTASHGDLRAWLLVVSLALIAAIHAALALLLTRTVTSRMLLREGEMAQQFLTSVVKAEDSGSHLFDQPAPSPALQSFSRHVENIPGTVRVNIYSPDGFIRYSTEKNFIGLQFPDNVELTEAVQGKLISKLDEVSDNDKPEHLAMNRFKGDQLVEAYIPVSNASGKVVTVVEFYREPQMVQQTVADIRRIIWAAAGLSGLILFIAIGLAVMFGTRRMTPH